MSSVWTSVVLSLKMHAGCEYPSRLSFKRSDHGSTRIEPALHPCRSVKSVVNWLGAFIRLRRRRAGPIVPSRLITGLMLPRKKASLLTFEAYNDTSASP